MCSVGGIMTPVTFVSALTSLIKGDVLHFRVLGRSIVVLGSAEAIYEYLDKQSANTSDRVQTPMIELYVPFPIHFIWEIE